MREQSSNTVASFFPSRDQAERAILNLKQSGFGPYQIGVLDSGSIGSEGSISSTGSDRQDISSHRTSQSGEHQEKGFWGRVGDFFTGDDYDEDQHTTGSGGYRLSSRTYESYRDRLDGGGMIVTVEAADRRTEAERILRDAGGEIDPSLIERSDIAEPAAQSGSGQSDTDRHRIHLLSERLRAEKEMVTSGEVRLRKDVITEKQSLEVPVTREELVVERRPASGQAASGEIGKESDIRIPLKEERVRVTKEPIVTEEVEVSKRRIQETARVQDDVRTEKLDVEKEGEVERTERRPRKTA